MYKKQVRMSKWSCIINGNKNEVENKKNRLHRYDINRSRPRHGHKYTKYKMCVSIVRVICIKQHHISKTFISNDRLKLVKNQAKAKQHSEAKLLLFENYLLFSSTLSSKNNKRYSKNCTKKTSV